MNVTLNNNYYYGTMLFSNIVSYLQLLSKGFQLQLFRAANVIKKLLMQPAVILIMCKHSSDIISASLFTICTLK